MNNKGQTAAIIGFLLFGIVFVMVLYLTAVPMAKVWDDISTELKGEKAFGQNNRTVQEIEQIDNFVTPAYDQIIFIAFAGILLVLLVTSIFFTDHPIFLIFLAIGFIVIMIIASQLVNVADTAVRNDELDNKVEDFTLSSAIFSSYLPIILLVVGFTAIIIVMARGRGVTA